MSTMEFFVAMGRLHKRRSWRKLVQLLRQPHPLLPGEREAFHELCLQRPGLVNGNRLRLDATGFRVVKQ
ncbi:MAG: hypothetical protein Q7S57_06100 [bacterium]|nr:hypothetical protein [bacterium]